MVNTDMGIQFQFILLEAKLVNENNIVHLKSADS